MKVLMKGNEALAEAAIRAGCKCYFGYPITPQNEVGAYMSEKIAESGGVFLQAESEIGAINMIYGCAATGTRCMTSSSSPGVSLKTEGISYIAGADLPCVIVNIQRGGPGLGTIQPSQADYFQSTRALGHGDIRVPVLAPYSVQEMVDMTSYAFDLGEKFRTPVMILADGLLGQMMEPVEFKDVNKTSGVDSSSWHANGHEGKRPPNVVNSLYLYPEELEAAVNERFTRLSAVESLSESTNCDDAEVVITAYGSCARVIHSAMEMARAEGIKAGTFRPITVSPFPAEQIRKACANAKKVLVVEMSMGQMVEDVRLAFAGQGLPVEFFGRQGGFVPGPTEILEAVRRLV